VLFSFLCRYPIAVLACRTSGWQLSEVTVRDIFIAAACECSLCAGRAEFMKRR
jgi:hypothetical protein